MYVLFRTLAHSPLWLLHILGSVLGWVAWLFSATYRRRFMTNAKQAGYHFAQIWPAIGQAGRMSLELPRLWLGRMPSVALSGHEHLVGGYAAGRGVMILTPHLGCFEMVAQAIVKHHGETDGPMTVLFRPARKPALGRIMEEARARANLITAPTTLSGVRQLLRALKQGQCVGLLPDQVPPKGMGVWADFFGKPAYTMTFAARMAQQSGATIVLAWGERLGWGRGFRVHFLPFTVPLSDTLEEAVGQINQAMESLIRRSPTQYLWGYARYKQPR
jgi:Kdo2-lipid IVA lauroyltransferase/acyltransferase